MKAPRSPTAKFRAREYSTTEASAVTGVPLATLNHYISRELTPLGIAVWGDGKRSITYDGLVALRMAYAYPKLLAPGSRSEVIEKALRASRKKYLTLENGRVIVRIDVARRVVSEGLRKLAQAKSAVTVDAGVLGGEPCLRGTRIPVHTVAGIATTVSVDEAKLTYSKLTKAQIELACFYAKAYPRRGRPKRVGDFLANVKPTSSRTFSVRID